MSKSKRKAKSKNAPSVTRFETAVEVQQVHDLCLEIQPIGHNEQPPHELADEIVSVHGHDCVEYSGGESGEIEWHGKRYSFWLTTDLCDSEVSIDAGWSNVEQVVTEEARHG